jgi:hypothetical protein
MVNEASSPISMTSCTKPCAGRNHIGSPIRDPVHVIVIISLPRPSRRRIRLLCLIANEIFQDAGSDARPMKLYDEAEYRSGGVDDQ